MGLKEKYFFEGAQRIGLPLEITKDITQAAFRPQQNAILAPRGVAGKTGDPLKLHFPQAQGCTLRPLLARLLRATWSPDQRPPCSATRTPRHRTGASIAGFSLVADVD